LRRLGILLSLVAAIFSCQDGFAQAVSRYNTFSYSVNEGLLQTTLGDIEIDKNNFCWISFPNGIQKFDGNSFVNVPVQPGLPDDKYTKFFRCKNGGLLISHSLGISKYNIETDNFSLVYKQPATHQRPVVFIGEDSGVLYCYDETGTINAFNSVNFKTLSVFKTNLPGAFFNPDDRLQFSDNIINNKTALKIGATVYLLDLKERKIVDQSTIESLVHTYMLRLKSENEVLYFDQKITKALQCWNFKTSTNTSFTVQGKDDKRVHRCVIFPWHGKTLLSFGNRLFETDSTLRVLQSELVNFQNQPVAGVAGIHRIKEDNFGNLYLQTINGGLRKIIRNNYPIKYFGTTEPKDNNILAVLPDKKNNRILTGGTGGLFVFDTLQHLVKHIKAVPGFDRGFIPNGIIQSGNGDYFVFLVNSKVVLRLNKDLSTFTSISFSSALPAIKSYSEYFGNLISNNGKSAIFQTQQKLYRIDFGNNKISEHWFSGAYILGGFWYNNTIISHGADELIFLDGETFKEQKKIPFNEPAGVRCFASDRNGSLYAGSNKGIFKIDTSGRILKQWNITTGLPDECVYAIAFDKEGLLWCSTNKGIFRIDKNNNLLQLSKQDGLQENEFNSNVVSVADDGEFYFGGINGVSSFYPSAISSFDEKVKVLLTGLKVNNENIYKDTGVYNIEKINLSFGQNSLSFDFVAMGSYNPDQYIYQYRMSDVDKEWIPNNNLQTVRYSLAPGKYIFQLYASRQFDKDAAPMKELVIVIDPPFWKAGWFRLLLGIAVVLILYYIINQRNKAKYTARLQQLEHEQQIKSERERISKDLHDSLGAYANAVLYNTELLEKENSEEKKKDLIGDLKFASKDIITSLRETVWALKKEQYTAEECLVRIRNFVQPLTRYYQHINFTIEGDAPADRVLHYTKALNVVRIVQEAVANSIKHSYAKNIHILSSAAEGGWNIIVQDDGRGFNIAELKESARGNGLNNMEQRAADAGFVYSVSSVENNGTSININL
jgi:signal transduction histidine kinase